MPLEQFLTQTALRFIDLFLDPNVIAVHRVVIGAADSCPKAARLFFESGPGFCVRVTTELICAQSDLKIQPDQVREIVHSFLNLVQGDYFQRSMLGLEFAMTEQKQQRMANNAAQWTLKMLATFKSDGKC